MQAPSKSQAVAAPAEASASLLVPTLAAVVATVSLLILLAPTVVRAQVKAVTPPAAAAPKATGTTTGSAHGALAAQTADKTDAAAKEAPKALPKGAKTSAPRNVSTTTGAPAADRVSSKPQLKVSAPIMAVEAHADAESHADAVVAVADSNIMAYDDALPKGTNRIWGSDVATQRGARGDDVSTIFQGYTYDAAETEEAVLSVIASTKPRPRSSEYASAPFAVNSPNLLHAGAVGRRTGTAAGSFRGVERVLLVDEVQVTLPAGIEPVVGARFVSVDVGSLLKPSVNVVSPTGVLEVIKVEAGRPVVARVIQQAGRIEEGQKLLPLEGTASASYAAVTAVPRSSGAPETQVVWISGDALLPSVQSFLMLGAGEREGVKAGDQFALVKRRGLGADAAEQRVALVRVVRVTEFGSTAIVIRQDQAGIAVGGAARLVGRVP